MSGALARRQSTCAPTPSPGPPRACAGRWRGRGRRRRLRRGPHRPRARGAGRGAVRPRGGAVHPDRVDGQRARAAALVGPGQEVLCESRPTSRAPSSAPTVRSSASPCAPGATSAARSTSRRSGRCTPPTWARSSCARPRSRWSTRTTSPGDRCSRSATCRRCALGRAAGLRGAHRRRPDLERPRRHRHPARGVRRGRRRDGGLPVQGARRAGRLADGRLGRGDRARRGCGASGWAAGCARSACSPPPALHALDHHLERLAEDHAHAALLAQACGVDPAARDQHRGRRRPDAAGFVARPASRGAGRGGRPARGRLLTHLDVDRAAVEQAAGVLGEDPKRYPG